MDLLLKNDMGVAASACRAVMRSQQQTIQHHEHYENARYSNATQNYIAKQRRVAIALIILCQNKALL